MDPAIDRSGDLDDYTVNFVTIRQGHSLAPMVKGLPGDSCQCPHWGYLISGQITVSYADRQEVYDAGDAFYMAPGTCQPPRPVASSSSSAPKTSWLRRSP